MIDTAGIWINAQPGNVTALSGEGTSELSWGNPQQQDPSSWVFDGVTDEPLDLNAVESEFKLGTFTHNNFPITGTFLTGATLQLTLDIMNGDNFMQVFNFDFTHNETSNSAPCNPAGATICPDVVGIPNAVSAESITFGGMDFNLEILGFKDNINDPNITEFITEENQANSTMLFGRLTKVQTPVPEPSTYLLFGAGLLGLAALRRKNAK